MKKLEKELQETEAVESQQKRAKMVSGSSSKEEFCWVTVYLLDVSLENFRHCEFCGDSYTKLSLLFSSVVYLEHFKCSFYFCLFLTFYSKQKSSSLFLCHISVC